MTPLVLALGEIAMTMDSEGTGRTPRSELKSQSTALEVVKPHSRFSPEDQLFYLSLVEELKSEKEPENPREIALVEEIALTYVRLQRARRLETATLNKYIEQVQSRFPARIDGGKALAIVFMENGAKLESMQGKEGKIEDAWYRAMADLDREQSARRNALPSVPDEAANAQLKSKRIHLVRPGKNE